MKLYRKIIAKIFDSIKFVTLPTKGDARAKLRKYLIYFLIVVIINIIAGKNITHLNYPLFSNVSMFLLLNINIAILLLLLILIFRNLIKILSEKKGSLKVKLLIFSSTIAILPVIIIFLYSSQLINSNVNKWFENQVTSVINKSSIFLNDFREYERKQLNNYLNYFQSVIIEKNLYSRDSIEKYSSDFCRYVYNDIFTNIIIFNSIGDITLQCGHSYETYLIEKLLDYRQDLIKYKYIYDYKDIARGIHWVGSYADKDVLEPFGILILKYTSLELYKNIEAIQKDIDTYTQNLYYTHPIKNSTIIQLLQISLLFLFAAIWVSMLFAGSIIKPIEELVEASKKISSGNFDVNIKEYKDGEIGDLVNAFNKMISQIKTYTNELYANNAILSEMFEQISRDNLYIDAIFKNVDSSIILLSNDLQILKSNIKADMFLSNHRKSFDEIVLNKVKDFMDDNKDEVIENFDLQDEKGSRIYFMSLSRITLSDENQVLILLGDVTDVVDAEKVALWKDIATKIAHEVKNPLTPIKLMAERVKKRTLKINDIESRDVINESMDIIITESENLKGLIEEFNMFARLPKADKHIINISSLLIDTISLYKESYKNITFNITCSEKIELNGDRLQLRRVLQNIISNAISVISNKDGVINIKVLETGNNVEIYIEDNGTGIDEHDIPNLFKPYFSKRQGGTGLGLAIVKKIVEEHFGEITAGNNESGGAFFKIILPVGL